MAWHRSMFELIKQSALVNPIKKSQEKRCGRAFAGLLSLSEAFLAGDDAGGGSLLKGERSCAFVDWAPTGIHLIPRCPMAECQTLRALGCIYTPNCCENADVATR